MTRHQKTFGVEPQSAPLSAQEQVVIYEARQILLRHLNQNPVLSSWQAVLDYCAHHPRRSGAVSCPLSQPQEPSHLG